MNIDRSGGLLTCNDVLDYVKKFLATDDCAGETVILQIGRQGGATPKQLYDYWKGQVNDDPDAFYISDHVPTLGEARGKIVLFSKFHLDDSSFGSDKVDYSYKLDDKTCQWALDISAWDAYEDNELAGATDSYKVCDGDDYEVWVEDNYESTATNKWNNTIENSLDNAATHRDDALYEYRGAWMIIYTSASYRP